MESEDAETERLLRWIAGAMGFELHCESEYFVNCEPGRWWFMVKPFPRGYTDELFPGWKITRSFYTQKMLLDNILKSGTVFLDGGQPLRNPFCGMSRDEAALRMAVAGA
jgi:hypothetical protein